MVMSNMASSNLNPFAKTLNTQPKVDFFNFFLINMVHTSVGLSQINK